MLFEMRHLERLAEIKQRGGRCHSKRLPKRDQPKQAKTNPPSCRVCMLWPRLSDVLLRKNKRATIEEVWTELQAVTGLWLDGDRRVFVELALLEAQEEQLPPRR